MVTQERNRPVVTDEELREITRRESKQNVNAGGNMLIVMGILEILLGLAAIGASAVSGISFAIFVGAAIMVSGMFEFVSAFTYNNLARFAWGIIGIAAGGYMMARPLTGVNILGAIVGVFLIASGIARLFGKERPLWLRILGALGIVLGIVVLANLASISPFLIGLLVGVYILVSGVLMVDAGSTLKVLAK